MANTIHLLAFDPVTLRGTLEVSISQYRMESARRGGMVAAKELAYLVKEGLESPTVIFEGIRQDEDEPQSRQSSPGSLCYCYFPKRAFYGPAGTEGKPFLGKIFMIFLNTDHQVYHWRWDPVDPDDYHMPKGFKERFKKTLFPRG